MFVFVRSLLYPVVRPGGRASSIHHPSINQAGGGSTPGCFFLTAPGCCRRRAMLRANAQHNIAPSTRSTRRRRAAWLARTWQPSRKSARVRLPRAGTTIPPHRPHIGASCRTTRHFLLPFRVTVRPPRGGLSSRGSITALTPPLPAHKHRDPHLSPRVSPRSLDHLLPFVDFEVSLLT